MAHQLGGFYNLPHGECNALLLPHAFTGKKEGEIGIQLRRNEETINGINKSEFCLVVSDNGNGIPEDLKLESVESLGMKAACIAASTCNPDFSSSLSGAADPISSRASKTFFSLIVRLS